MCIRRHLCELLLGDAGVSEPLLRSHAVRLQATVVVFADMLLLHVVPIDLT